MGIFTGLPHNVTFSTENALAETSHISIIFVWSTCIPLQDLCMLTASERLVITLMHCNRMHAW